MPPVLPRVYPITDKALSGRSSHLEIVRELARGGATCIQVRDKTTPARDLLDDLRRCARFCGRRGITLIVNDRCDLALAAGSAGVHLGQEDLTPEAARRILGVAAIVGLSTHSLPQARRAGAEPVDYIGFGPVFPSPTKQSRYAALGLDRLARACRSSRIPVVAIGGIGAGNLRSVLEKGAGAAAVIGDLMRAPDLARRMELLLRLAAP